MNFSDAILKAKDGYKLKAKEWLRDTYMYFRGDVLMLHTHDGNEEEFILSQHDIERDYYIVHDGPKEDDIVEAELCIVRNENVLFIVDEHILYGDGDLIPLADPEVEQMLRTGIKRKYNKTKKCFVEGE